MFVAVAIAAVSALQQSVLLQRSHPMFWVELAGCYRCLRKLWRSGTQSASAHARCIGGGGAAETTADQCSVDGEYCHVPSACKPLPPSSSAVDILSRTVELFRPYFSWKRPSETGGDHLEVSSSDDELSVRHHCSDHCSSCSDECPFCEGITSGEPTLCPDTLSTCSKRCILQQEPLTLTKDDSGKSSENYVSALASAAECTADEPLVGASGYGRSSSPLPSVCIDHSLFVAMVRGAVLPAHAGRIVEWTESCHQQQSRLDHFARQFAVMAECSCLLWAR